MKIENIKMSILLYSFLRLKNVNNIEDLNNFTTDDVMRWHNFGRRSMEELMKIMNEYKVNFRQENE